MFLSCFRFFNNRHPANPIIAGKGRYAVPRGFGFRRGCQRLLQIRGQCVQKFFLHGDRSAIALRVSSAFGRIASNVAV